MQVILGSGGAIGTELARALPHYTPDIRLVSRNPKKVNSTDELFEGDLTDADRVAKAVQGAEVAYLTVGLPYNTATWRSTWPVVMANVINACKQHGTKLVFFDNVYMYDPQHLSPMTEDTPINPSSNKGKVRRQIADQTNARGAGPETSPRSLPDQPTFMVRPSMPTRCSTKRSTKT